MTNNKYVDRLIIIGGIIILITAIAIKLNIIK
jgi:hypothetical protein